MAIYHPILSPILHLFRLTLEVRESCRMPTRWAKASKTHFSVISHVSSSSKRKPKTLYLSMAISLTHTRICINRNWATPSHDQVPSGEPYPTVTIPPDPKVQIADNVSKI